MRTNLFYSALTLGSSLKMEEESCRAGTIPDFSEKYDEGFIDEPWRPA
jgi:hypothetical protein